MPDQINFFLDAVDDVLLADGIPAFDGGQFSNLRANLLQNTQSKLLLNVDIDKLGKLRTRRGTIILGGVSPSGATNKIIQGLTSYQTPTANYVVAAHDTKIWKFTGSGPPDDAGTWVQIATGGTADNEDILICREGLINAPAVVGPPAVPAGYTMGTTAIVVDGLPAVAAPLFAPGEKLYFVNNRRTAPYEYVIHSWNAGTSTITLEEPGLVFDVGDNWKFIVTRPAKVNNVAGYAAGVTTIAIDGYSGEVFDTEKFVIRSENVTHTISSHTPGGAGTTGLTFTPGLIADYTTTLATSPVVFAQGNDALYFSDGVKPIYSWNGKTLGKLDSHSILDDLQGSTFSKAVTDPPIGPHILLWFQNRLIASGVAEEPDAIFFSDYFDPSSWDRLYQMVRIGGGESDPITGLLAWTDYNMLVFKKNSIYVINLDPSQNSDPNDPTLLVASFAVKQLHKKIGCPAPRTAVQVGGGSTTPGSDIFFLDGDKKVHSIRRVMAAETQQEVGQAMSLPIQDVMDLINIENIDKACATYHNEHYILSIPWTRAAGFGVYPNMTVAYNLLTQSWCGLWTGWVPTCYAMRTDLGQYSKMIIGNGNVFPTYGGVGCVLQWLDDQSLDEETDDTYADFGNPVGTQILTRAFTFGDFYSFKTGLSVELEFDESVSEAVTVRVFLDKIEQVFPGRGLLAPPFSTLSEVPLRLPLTGGPPLILPFTLPASPDLKRMAFDLQRYGTWRELQFRIDNPVGKLAIRSIRLTGFMDTIRLQTVPPVGVPAIDIPPDAAGGP